MMNGRLVMSTETEKDMWIGTLSLHRLECIVRGVWWIVLGLAPEKVFGSILFG